MKLLLTSNGLSTGALKEKFLGMMRGVNPCNDQVVIAYITNALPRWCAPYFWWRTLWLRSMNFDVRIINLKDENAAALLRECGCIYVEGGNTFRLALDLENSGITKQLINLIGDWHVPYVGISAGSILLAPSLETAYWLGDQLVAGQGATKWQGLGLYHSILLPHFRDDEYLDVADRAKELQYSVVPLRDGEALFVDGIYEERIALPSKRIDIFSNRTA